MATTIKIISKRTKKVISNDIVFEKDYGKELFNDEGFKYIVHTPYNVGVWVKDFEHIVDEYNNSIPNYNVEIKEVLN